MQRAIVHGNSMENNLHNGENLIVEKVSRNLDMLNRFNIITFYPHGIKGEKYYIKRIIALPGEAIQIKGNTIYINGKKLKEDYGKEPIRYAGIASKPLKLKEDEYFVMGDNREISLDSRYEEVGAVNKKNIGGRAVFRFWPLSKIGLLH